MTLLRVLAEKVVRRCWDLAHLIDGERGFLRQVSFGQVGHIVELVVKGEMNEAGIV